MPSNHSENFSSQAGPLRPPQLISNVATPPPDDGYIPPSLDDIFARSIQYIHHRPPTLAANASDSEYEREDPLAQDDELSVLLRELSYLDIAAVSIRNVQEAVHNVAARVSPFANGPWRTHYARMFHLGLELWEAERASR